MAIQRSLFGRSAAAHGVLAAAVVGAASLAGSASGQVFFGMPHAAEGGAALAPQPDGTLIVSNIGSSGCDGVRVDLGDSNGWWMNLDFATPTDVACETIVCKMQRVELALAGSLIEEIGFRFDEVVGGEVAITPHALNLTIGCVTVRVENADQLVGVHETTDPTAEFTRFIPDGTPVRCIMNVRSQSSPSIFPTSWGMVMDFAAPTDVTLPGESPVQATRINILYEGDTGDTSNPLYETASVTGSNSGTDPGDGELHLHAEGIVHRDIACRASDGGHIAGARLPTGGGLVVSNIGSSGCDGVRYVVPEVDDEVLCAFSPLSPPLIDGAAPVVLNMTSQVLLDTLPPGSPASSSILVGDMGAGVRLHGQFDAAYGASNVTVELFDGGVSAGSVVLPLVPGGNPTDLGGIQDVAQVRVDKFHFRQEFGPTHGAHHRVGFPNAIEYTPPGLPPLICDEIQITPDGSAIVLDILTLDLAGQNLLPFTIDEVTSGLFDDPKTTSFGIEHEDIGGARSSLSPVGHLTVSNIGSSGCDGVSIDIGEVDGWCGELDFGERGALPLGMSLTITARDVFGNPIPSFSVQETDGGSATGVFSWWDVTRPINVRLLNGTTVIDSVSHPQSGGALVVGNIGSSGKDGVRFRSQYRESNYDFLVRLPSPQTLTLQGTSVGPLLADGFVVTLDVDPINDPPMTIVDVTAADVPSFTILREALGMFGSYFRALDGAGLTGYVCGEGATAGGDHLIVSNIGSSGCDGVSIDLGDLDSDNDGIPEGFARTGESFVLDGTHSVDDGQVSSFTWTQTSGPFVFSTTQGAINPATGERDFLVSPDPAFSPGSLRVDVLLGGVVQSSTSGVPPGLVASTISPTVPGSYVFELTVVDTVGLRGVGHRFAWDSAQDIATSGPLAGSVSGDELHISWETGDDSSDVGESHLLSSASGGGGALALSGAEVIELCPADLAPAGGDGSVGIQDLLFLLAAWGTPAGDVDGDGNTGITDLLAVLAVWGSCAP